MLFVPLHIILYCYYYSATTTTTTTTTTVAARPAARPVSARPLVPSPASRPSVGKSGGIPDRTKGAASLRSKDHLAGKHVGVDEKLAGFTAARAIRKGPEPAVAAVKQRPEGDHEDDDDDDEAAMRG